MEHIPSMLHSDSATLISHTMAAMPPPITSQRRMTRIHSSLQTPIPAIPVSVVPTMCGRTCSGMPLPTMITRTVTSPLFPSLLRPTAVSVRMLQVLSRLSAHSGLSSQVYSSAG